MTQTPKKFPPKKRNSKKDQESLDDLKERGLVGRDNPGSRNAEYSEMRSRPGIYPDQVAHPGFEEERYNHRQKEFSHVDVGPLDSVFTAQTNENYRLGGWPKWLIKATSQLDRHIFDRATYRQGTFDGYSNESTRKIARAVGATGDAVQRSIRHLVKLGLLIEVYPASGKSPAYFRTRSPWELEPPRNLLNRAGNPTSTQSIKSKKSRPRVRQYQSQ